MNNSCISYASLNDKVKTKRQNIHCNQQQLIFFFFNIVKISLSQIIHFLSQYLYQCFNGKSFDMKNNIRTIM